MCSCRWCSSWPDRSTVDGSEQPIRSGHDRLSAPRPACGVLERGAASARDRARGRRPLDRVVVGRRCAASGHPARRPPARRRSSRHCMRACRVRRRVGSAAALRRGRAEPTPTRGLRVDRQPDRSRRKRVRPLCLSLSRLGVSTGSARRRGTGAGFPAPFLILLVSVNGCDGIRPAQRSPRDQRPAAPAQYLLVYRAVTSGAISTP